MSFGVRTFRFTKSYLKMNGALRSLRVPEGAKQSVYFSRIASSSYGLLAMTAHSSSRE